ncbi:GDP-6-deoxy-D-mannose reductase [Rubripirellula lacrimiformis]|uniref:GDP-6-deoxy-D-mannose reductase n=1 Tax=Rubripirellula lacrimiformis TaxID=1930273 RepID=A0A517N8N5_9BACT|nr:SDR family oxidoreductase [Rubripirellula lacrimiformis]QDT03490.1 GDP-6-deoxy-D-mannose reductase [Rubripirellula lacrimiformis]
MSTILVTGARGFIGRTLAVQLSRSDNAVVGIGHGSISQPRYHSFGLTEWINGEIDHANLQLIQRRCGQIDSIFHLAGGSHVGRSFENPAEDFLRTVVAAGQLLEWVRLTCPHVPIVIVSSAAVYGAGHIGPIAEDARLNPFSPYGTHKAMLESLAKSYCDNFGLRIAICRLFSVYGEGLEKQLIYDLCCKAETVQKNNLDTLALGGTGNELRDWIHVQDVAELLQQIHPACSEACPIFNGGSGTGVSVSDVASVFTKSWGGELKASFNQQQRSGDPKSLVASTHRLKEIGFAPKIDLASGIGRVIESFRSKNAESC